ncbi:hypothetical protein yc1106_08348 [Curvularia clavata]|uniref:NACHT domain-containing protein n=1 Tax=Curvularia clavata TaxID=95742 RepID=A0A9Q8ZE90_CURCL|nr:hypothetical protein yc1106_08348 [Curvularia clavata]
MMNPKVNSPSPYQAPDQAAVACRNALFLTDPYVDRESVISAKGKRVAGTCEWITQNESYRAWSNSDSDRDGIGDTRLLWISGGPGKGKTMMSVFLTEELERHIEHTDNADLVFFFCSAQDEKRNTSIAILRGLVHQIIVKRQQLVHHALPYFETPERTQQTLSSLETLWIIFSKLIASAELGTVFCVLDGLDECEDSTLRVLLPRLVDLLADRTPSPKNSAFKLAIVSRDLPGLRGCTTRVKLDPDNDEKVAGDIELFVSTRVGELSTIEGFSENFRASVQTALLQRAEGTFLWVGFAMYELSQKQTCVEILEALKELPSGLPAIYSRMLLQIPARQRELSQAILRWVTMAARPLQLRELAAAVGVQATSPQITVDQAVRDAIALCGPLLKVQEKEVSLIHQSVRDYLLRKERDSDAVLEAFRLIVEPSHLELAQRCLSCIAQSGFQQRVIYLDAELDPQESPLLRYATIYWPEHARSASSLATKLFDPYGLFLQKKSFLRYYWWQAYWKEIMGYEDQPIPLLHIACTLNIIPWVEAVLEKRRWSLRYRRWVNKKDSRRITALHYAAREGHEAVALLLVDRGADLKAKDEKGGTPLHSAASSWKENKAVVQLLVDRGADIKATDNNGKTPLHWAAWVENEVVVQLLVDRGADLKAKEENGMTPLHSAASSWEENEAVVRLLVDRGADIKATDNYGMTPLHSAAWVENEVVVQLLVDLGADLKATDTYGMTPLHWAARAGNEVVVKLLVDRGADLKAKDKDGVTPLHSAASSWKENKTVVQLLVDLGADIKAKDENRETPLHSAARVGNEMVVKLLVDLKADLKAKDEDGKTPLHSAAWEGHETVVRLQVDREADVKAKDSKGRMAP